MKASKVLQQCKTDAEKREMCEDIIDEDIGDVRGAIFKEHIHL